MAIGGFRCTHAYLFAYDLRIACAASAAGAWGQCRKGASRMSRYISIAEAADQLGVDPLTIRRWIAHGKINAYRVGPKLVRLDLDEVDQLAKPIPTVASKPARKTAARKTRKAG
jgi:excisionase family DNA binding protein